MLRNMRPEPGADYQVQRDSIDEVEQDPAQYAGQQDYQREWIAENNKKVMSDISVRVVPQRLAVDRTGECVHSDRAAEPDQGDLYLELDHSGYPVGKQGESCVGDQGPHRDEEGLDVPARRFIFYVSAGIAESEEACLDDSNAG